MLSKLSLRNAKRQVGDYLVYFITVTLAAALLYSFNGFIDSKEILNLGHMLHYLPVAIVLASVAVAGIMGWLVFYTMRFMLEKRSREFGTYLLLGLETRQVSRLYLIENLVIGTAALLFGILLGNLLFQGLRAIMLWMFYVPYSFRFTLSIKALGLTLLYFVLIYAFALWRCGRRIRRMKIHELLYAERKNEDEPVESKARRRIFLILSVLAGIAGLILLPFTKAVWLRFLGAVLLVFFLYGFFISFSSAVPAYFNARPARKYAKVNLLVFRSLSAKLATMGITMATLALLFTGTLVTESMGVSMTYAMNRRVSLYTQFDLFIGKRQAAADFGDYKAVIRKNVQPREEYEYDTYSTGDDAVLKYLRTHIDRRTWSTNLKSDMVMRRSDYDKLRNMLGYKAVALDSGSYLIHCQKELHKSLAAYAKPLAVGGRTLKKSAVYSEPFNQLFADGNGEGYILVVPDAAADGLAGANHCLAVQTRKPVGEETVAKLEKKNVIKAGDPKIFDNIVAKQATREDMMSQLAVIVFPLFYLALILILTAVTILSTQILSEAGRSRREFALLSKLGQSRRDMLGTVRRQFALFYAMPVVLPIFIMVFVLTAFDNLYDPGIISTMAARFGIIGVGVLIFLVIYLIYAVASYISYKRGVLPAE